MYFWRIDELKAQMRAGPVPPRDVLGYLLWMLTSIWLPPLLLRLVPFPVVPDARSPVWPEIVLLTMTAVGLWVAYRANCGGAGRDFAGRLLAVHWVLGIRFLPGFFVVVTSLVAVASLAGFISSDPNAVPDELVIGGIMAGFLVLFYWRLAHHLGEVASPAEVDRHPDRPRVRNGRVEAGESEAL